MARASLLTPGPLGLLFALVAAGPLAQAQPAADPSAPPSASSSAPASPAASIGATGYGYSRRQEPLRAVRRAKPPPKGPYATMPGFELLADGRSRLFVALSLEVPVEEKKAQGTLTYVLKGARLGHRNNANALVTVHFNTPVARARLVPSGADLLFVVDLRSAAAGGTWKMTAAKDGSALLTLDFPKGEYVPQGPARPADVPLDAPMEK